jgi:hypothetical protein
VKGDRVPRDEAVDEADAVDTTTNYFNAFVTEMQLAPDKFESATRHRSEITVQGHDVPPANPTLVEHVERDARAPGAQ